ncbi:VOC family protein [Streptomyces sp. LE64]|uniref:VOC family protein n=1 Tax=Streptomyces sp. LE64 TaxID=3448653 RepID=UPI004042D52F
MLVQCLAHLVRGQHGERDGQAEEVGGEAGGAVAADLDHGGFGAVGAVGADGGGNHAQCLLQGEREADRGVHGVGHARDAPGDQCRGVGRIGQVGRFVGEAQAHHPVGAEGAPLPFGDVPGSGFRPPVWPDPAHSKQAHLELGVEDLDAAQERMLALGAVLPDFQPNPEAWRVLLDPAGHPFCLATHGV